MSEEFERQVQNLISKGYPKIAGMSEEDFIKLLGLLKNKLPADLSEPNAEQGILPFVIVFKNSLIPAEKQMQAVTYNSKEGLTKLYPHEPKNFQNTDVVNIPDGSVYLLVNINRGDEFLNIRPEDALKEIISKNKTPLNIDEGIAIITQFPEFLIKNKCFSLLASRHTGDQRVPAIWINANKQANLGWCWDRNPHTWLGSAFAEKRI